LFASSGNAGAHSLQTVRHRVNLHLCGSTRRGWARGILVPLPRSSRLLEYKLLVMLVKGAGKVVTHGQLLAKVRGPTATG
jgi:DNA-binding response OmpR family regulator